jgi:hypothetical protein
MTLYHFIYVVLADEGPMLGAVCQCPAIAEATVAIFRAHPSVRATWCCELELPRLDPSSHAIN